MAIQDRVQHALALGERRARAALARRSTSLEHRRGAAARAAEQPLGITITPAQPAQPQVIQAAGSPARVHLVAEGDSWFDYPGTDVLDALEDYHAVDVHSVAHMGDRIEKMAYLDGQLDKLVRLIDRLLRNQITPQAILLSGGGNDLVVEDFGALLNHIDSPTPGLNAGVVDGVIHDRIFYAYITVIHAVTALCDEQLNGRIPVVIHGYDYPVPDGRGFFWLPFIGPWLEPGFDRKGYGDTNLAARTAIAKDVIDIFHQMLTAVAGHFPHVRYADLRGTLSNNLSDYKQWWTNELHPTDDGFKAVAAKIAAVL